MHNEVCEAVDTSHNTRGFYYRCPHGCRGPEAILPTFDGILIDEAQDLTIAPVDLCFSGVRSRQIPWRGTPRHAVARACLAVAAVARSVREDRARQHDPDRTSSATGYGDASPHRGNGDAQHARGSPFLCRAIRGGVLENVCHDDSGLTNLCPVLVCLVRRARSSQAATRTATLAIPRSTMRTPPRCKGPIPRTREHEMLPGPALN